MPIQGFRSSIRAKHQIRTGGKVGLLRAGVVGVGDAVAVQVKVVQEALGLQAQHNALGVRRGLHQRGQQDGLVLQAGREGTDGQRVRREEESKSKKIRFKRKNERAALIDLLCRQGGKAQGRG